MATNLFKRPPPPPQNFVGDPYAPFGLRAWDDYQFRRKGIKSGGGPELRPPINIMAPVATLDGFFAHSTQGEWTGTRPLSYSYQWFRTPFGDPPTIVVIPAVSGIETEGETLSCLPGTWDGTEPITYSYQWFRTGSAPISEEAPMVSGLEIESETLEAVEGEWGGSEPITYTYQWFRTRAFGSVATRAYLPSDYWAGGTYTQFNSRSWHRAVESVNSLWLVFANWRGWQELVAGVGTVALSASIEYPMGTLTQVHFNGNAVRSMDDGATVISDRVIVSIPAGAAFWVRSYVQGPVGAYKMGGGLADPANGDLYEAVASGTFDKTMSGTIPAATDFIYMPSAILGLTSQPSVALVGDSRVFGTIHGVDPPDGDRGELAPRVANTGQAYLNMGCSSDSAQAYIANHARRVALINAYCTKVILQYGINDVLSERTDAQLQADLNTIRSYFPGLPVELSTMPPVSTSTDGWTTLEGQTPWTPIGAPNRIANNNWRRSVPSGFSACVEVADAVETERDSGFWKFPGYTEDGAHHTLTSEEAIEVYVPSVPGSGLVLTDEDGEALTDDDGEELLT